MPSNSSFRVIHCFRSPVGGLFRHVVDLIEQQYWQGIYTGLVCDSTTGGEYATRTLARIRSKCQLGIHRLPIGKYPGARDITVFDQIKKLCENAAPDIVHGHGAKGGGFARLLAGKISAKAVYTPHGGSLHYSASSPQGLLFLGLEKWLNNKTDGFVFESAYSAETYQRKIGKIKCPYRIVHNGLHKSEFTPVQAESNASDFVFIGELRRIKGIDTFLLALTSIKLTKPVRALLIGDGPQRERYLKMIQSLGLASTVRIIPPQFPARSAFTLGKRLIVPSLAESLPYIVLEAAAASMPLIATQVGGIGEIFGPYADALLPPGDAKALAGAMTAAMDNPTLAAHRAELLRDHVLKIFDVGKMEDGVYKLYELAMQPTRTIPDEQTDGQTRGVNRVN